MIKKLLFFTLTMTLLITAGCTSDESSGVSADEETTTKEDVTTVLEQMYTGPDEELIQLYEQGSNEELLAYYRDEFGPYLTENFMEKAIATNLVTGFHQKANSHDVKMKIADMSVEQSEDKETAYDFAIQIDISNGETAEVSGRVNTNEAGKVTRIHFQDPLPLLNAFDTAVKTEEGLFEYDPSKLVSRIADEAYQPKLPTVMPFEVDGVEIEAGPMKQNDTVLTFNFHGQQNEMMDLMTVKNGEVSYQDVKTEEVAIGDQTGRYAGEEGGVQRMIWTDGSITYELKGKLEGLSKENLITVAESFE